VISQGELKQYLHYEPDTGEFYWLVDTQNTKAGSLAGGKNALGYWQIGLLGRRLLGHRLAWLFMYGYMPKYLDHKNGKPWDNRISNLRECNQQQNLLNSDQLKRGVEKHGRKWRARVGCREFRVEIGSYDTEQEAQEAYNSYVTQVHGDFARVNRGTEEKRK
jgi:hypothetical protein